MASKALTRDGLLFAACVVAAFAMPCDAAARLRFITLGTAGPNGTYFAVGSSICRLVAEQSKRESEDGKRNSIRCVAPPTGGSRYNIRQLSLGAMEFGLAQSDWQYHAYHGSAADKVTPFPELRSVFSIYPEPFQVVVGKGANVRGFLDLKGKRVNIGNPGSGQRGTMKVLMEGYGVVPDDFAVAREFTSTEYVKALCDDEIDAFVSATAAPQRNIAFALDNCGASILDLNTEVEKRLVSARPYYALLTIPGNTYEAISESVTTLGVMATLVTRTTVDADLVYDLVRLVMENLDQLRSRHGVLADLDPQRMIQRGLSAPLHDGALRYYREQGWR